MDWVPLHSPQTEPELVALVSLLQAHAIPHFVHNAGFGGLFPGLEIPLYNIRTIMVPATSAPAARELLASFLQAEPTREAAPKPGGRDKLRMIFEALFLGWFFPGTRYVKKKGEDDKGSHS
jgi:putative signal transducing protein